MPGVDGITVSQDLYEESRKVLFQSNSEGVSLADHLSNVILKVLETKPEDAVSSFENLSWECKEEFFVPPSRAVADKISAQAEIDLQKGSKLAGLFAPATQAPSGEDEEAPAEANPDGCTISDIMDEMNTFINAGVGLSREEVVRVALSLKRLGGAQALKSLRFFGKILTTSGQYYVAESIWHDGAGIIEAAPDAAEAGEGDDADAGEGAADEEGAEGDAAAAANEQEAVPTAPPAIVIPTEDQGTGANMNTYWVCTELGGEWTRLPNVAPAHISAARNVRRFFTGNLEAAVLAYPPFPGTEAHLLRANLARMAHALTLAPKGALGYAEDDEEQSGEPGAMEEFAGLSGEELADLENWVHTAPLLLKQGRVSWWKPAKEPSGDGEEEEGGDEEEDPAWPKEEAPARLSSLASNEADAPLWMVRSSGLNPATQTTIIRSLRWPGAATSARSKAYANIYVGWGLPASSEPYVPQLPPPVQKETAWVESIREVAPPLASLEQELEDQERELEEKEREAAQAEGEAEE